MEKFVSSLTCKKSAPSISFRGNIIRRHTSIPGWSLTSYLKTLHTVMSWETIYWHVWATCIILRPNIKGKNRPESTDLTISAIEVDRYTLEIDGLLILRRYLELNYPSAVVSDINILTFQFLFLLIPDVLSDRLSTEIFQIIIT